MRILWIVVAIVVTAAAAFAIVRYRQHNECHTAEILKLESEAANAEVEMNKAEQALATHQRQLQMYTTYKNEATATQLAFQHAF